MKITQKIIYYFIGITLIILSACKSPEIENAIVLTPSGNDSSGTALVISGASARISHELALIERLQTLGYLNDVEFIGGLSSGAISAVSMNAILDPTNPFKWDDMKKILFSLKNDSLFAKSDATFPLDTRRMWRLFDDIFRRKMGFNSVTDFKIPTMLKTLRMDNKEVAVSTNIAGFPSFTNNPVEALMASASMPLLFPAIRVNSVSYIDGGSAGAPLPIIEALKYQLSRGKYFKKMILVTFQHNKQMQWGTEMDLAGLNGIITRTVIEGALKAAGYNLDAASQVEFVNQLKYLYKNYPQFSKNILVFTPNVSNPPYFGLLDFNSEESRFNTIKAWADQNYPVTLEEYLKDK